MQSTAPAVDRAHAFAADLADPQRPSSCPECIYDFLLQQASSGDADRVTRPEWRPFLNAVMALIVAPRESDSSAALGFRLARHRCAFHCTWHGWSDNHFIDHILVASCQFMATSLVMATRKLRFKRSMPRHSEPVWPVTQDELFPLGLHQTVKALVRLCSAHILGSTALLGSVILRCRSLVFSEILADENRSQIIRIISDTLVSCRRSSSPGLPADDEHAFRVQTSAEPAAMLLRYICTGPGFCECDLERFTRGFERVLYPALLASLSLLHDPTESLFLHTLTARLHQQLGLRHTPPPLIDTIHFLCTDSHDPYGNLLKHMGILRRLTSCLNTSCRMHVHDRPSGHTFPCCSRCRMVQYCSQACQRVHWQESATPHKGLCGALRQAAEYANVSNDAEDFAARCRAHSFPRSDVERLTDWIKSIV